MCFDEQDGVVVTEGVLSLITLMISEINEAIDKLPELPTVIAKEVYSFLVSERI